LKKKTKITFQKIKNLIPASLKNRLFSNNNNNNNNNKRNVNSSIINEPSINIKEIMTRKTYSGEILPEDLIVAKYNDNIKGDENNDNNDNEVIKTKLKFEEKDYAYLAVISSWNIQSRYPDYKLKAYKIATDDYCNMAILKTEKIRKWMLEQMQ
jgi:hypothetical protein